MILVDPKEGSKEILHYIQSIPGHPPAEHQPLQFGDIAFTAEGPQGIMMVGLEVKSVSDVVNCIETQRFTGHQVIGLKQMYDAAYLLIYGEFRAEWETGALQIKLDKGKGGFWWTMKTGSRVWTHYELMSWLTVVELGWGIRSRTVLDMKGVARTVLEMYKALQKPWEKHKSLNPFYLGPPGITPFTQPTLVEKVVAQVEGIGPAKAREVGGRFGSVAEMLTGKQMEGALVKGAISNALVKWKGIHGIGKPTAERILKEFWGLNKNEKENQ